MNLEREFEDELYSRKLNFWFFLSLFSLLVMFISLNKYIKMAYFFAEVLVGIQVLFSSLRPEQVETASLGTIATGAVIVMCGVFRELKQVSAGSYGSDTVTTMQANLMKKRDTLNEQRSRYHSLTEEIRKLESDQVMSTISSQIKQKRRREGIFPKGKENSSGNLFYHRPEINADNFFDVESRKMQPKEFFEDQLDFL